MRVIVGFLLRIKDLSDTILEKKQNTATRILPLAETYLHMSIEPHHNGSSMLTVEALQPGTPEWFLMNRRRGELIRQKNRQGLSPEEHVEFEKLQQLSLSVLSETFPAPPLDLERLVQLEASLAGTSMPKIE